ncbi:sialidase family protein [Brachyspira pilosicoli]|uniref:sialidase family protein n=1 Tax=Brachyspira pilosicoli TaxID=52584 RepID=UPI0012F4FD2F|nr:sialidase family protein [Brachyspira pilosicoli]
MKKKYLLIFVFIFLSCGTDYYYSSFNIKKDLQWMVSPQDQANMNKYTAIANASKFNQYTSPAIVATPANYVLAVYENRSNPTTDIIGLDNGLNGTIDIMASISTTTDNFQIDRTIGGGAISSSDSHASPIAFVNRDGNVVVLAVGGVGFGAGQTTDVSKISLSISSNNGNTWSDWEDLPQEIFNDLSNKGYDRYYTTPGTGIVLGNGTLACTIEYRSSKSGDKNTPAGSAILYSTDNGENWHIGATLTYGGANSHRFARIIAERRDGKLLIAAVKNTGKNDYNTKGALAWYLADNINGTINSFTVNGLPENNGGTVSGGRIKYVYDGQSRDGILLLHSGPERRYTNPQGTPFDIPNPMAFSISEDEGANWKLITNLVGTAGISLGSFKQSMVIFKDGTIGTAIEESLGATISPTANPEIIYFSIMFRRVSLHSLSGGEYTYEGL